MVVSAPTIDPRLLAALVRLDNSSRPIAETNRQLGMVADHLAVPRPSYEQVRVLVHELRTQRLTVPSAWDLLLDIAFRSRPPEAVLRDLLR